MTDNTHPKVAVLMATYNGLPMIAEQIKKILSQTDVKVFLYISDDASTDGTLDWLEALSSQNEYVKLLTPTERLRGASRNFFRLVIDLDLSAYDFIAFSDQDDIWLPNKLRHQVDLIKNLGVDGVSSDVIAFWPDGKKKLIVKSQPQKELDFLFESAGPGCTFLMTHWLVNKVREQLTDENSLAIDVALHDWLTYAICRSHGRKWLIDSEPSVYYRQHEMNVIGANVGRKAKWARLQKIRQGWYRNEVIKIVQICNSIYPNVETEKLGNLLVTKNLFSQFKLLAYVTKARRSLLDRCLLSLSILVGIF